MGTTRRIGRQNGAVIPIFPVGPFPLPFADLPARPPVAARWRHVLTPLSATRLDIQFEVTSAYEELEESRQTLQLFSEKLIPAAEQNVAAARSNYDVSKASFLVLATAQRQLITLREERETTLATYHKRFAELTRVTGGTAVATTSPTESQPMLQPASQ